VNGADKRQLRSNKCKENFQIQARTKSDNRPKKMKGAKPKSWGNRPGDLRGRKNKGTNRKTTDVGTCEWYGEMMPRKSTRRGRAKRRVNLEQTYRTLKKVKEK